jgi:hypothetical protein
MQPNQALPAKKQRDFADSAQQADSRRPENVIARSAIQISEMQNS